MTRRHRLLALRIVLAFGALFYFMGAISHYSGLSLFPWYDNTLYTPYHDSLIALAGLVIAMFIATVAEDPIHNKDTLNVIIVGAVLAGIFSIGIIWKVNLDALGAHLKKVETIFEGLLGFLFAGLLWWLYPRK